MIIISNSSKRKESSISNLPNLGFDSNAGEKKKASLRVWNGHNALHDEAILLAKIKPDKDVDGLHTLNLGKLLKGEPGPRSLPSGPHRQRPSQGLLCTNGERRFGGVHRAVSLLPGDPGDGAHPLEPDTLQPARPPRTPAGAGRDLRRRG